MTDFGMFVRPSQISFNGKRTYMNFTKIKRIFKYTGIGIASLFLIATLYVCITHVEPKEVGLQRNWVTGELFLKDSGLYIRPPWIWITKVPINPIRVSVSTSSKGYSAKLVQFNPQYFKEFVETEGWRYYWWANRFSFNSGYDKQEEFRGFRDIARGYAYSAIEYPYFKILDEYEKE